MSIAQNFPALKPSLNLDFANVKKLDPRISFSRASTARVYDGKSVAKAEENLLQYSQEFDSWAKVNVTGTPNVTTAPDGTSTAYKAIATSSGGSFYRNHSQPVSFVNTLSIIDLTDGSVATNATGTWDSLVITDVGSGWYRIIGQKQGYFYSFHAKADDYDFVSIQVSTTRVYIYPQASGDGSVAPDGTSGIYLWGAQLEQRDSVTAYTPTTTQPITNYIPVLQTASANVARFDHDPVTGESLGLLVEEQRTNLFTYSEQINNGAWVKNSITVTTNQVIAPDGTLTMDKIVPNSGASMATLIPQAVRDFVTVSASTAYTLSTYSKKGEFDRIVFFVRDTATGSNFARVTVSLEDGSITSSAQASGTYTNVSAKVDDVGNGVYRISLTFTTGANTSIRTLFIPQDSVANNGDGYSGIYIWGAQLEAGTFPTSYIKTEASQVTRSADSASMTGTNFSEWYRQDEGTLYAEAIKPHNFGSTVFMVGDFVNSIYTNLRANENPSVNVIANSITQADIRFSGTSIGNSKLAFAYKTNDIALANSAGNLGVDTSAIVPSVQTILSIGTFRNAGTLTQSQVYIKKLAYYPARLTNEQLQALTS